MRLYRRFILIAFLAVCALHSYAQGVAPQVRAFEPEVQVSGVTPHASVVIFGITLSDGRTLAEAAEIVQDTDGDGKVTFRPAYVLPRRGIWAAIDLESGAWSIGGREGYEIRRSSFPRDMTKKNAEGLITGLEQERAEMTVLIARPGKGAWITGGSEGASSDADGQRNGKLLLNIDHAVPVGNSSGNAPKNLKRGDVVVAIDTFRFEVFASAVE